MTAQTSPLSTTIDRARHQIELLREYRARLIADVVTGKLDMREAAARLSDETEASQPMDRLDALPTLEEDVMTSLDSITESTES